MDIWGLLLIALGLLIAGYFIRQGRNSRRLAYIESFQFHSALLDRVARKRPDMSQQQWLMVADALRDYFVINLLAKRRMVSMPSQVVDDLWHEFILFTRLYKHFCGKAFGRYLHHTPVEGMSSPTVAEEGIKQAWRLACQREGINPRNPDRLPRLFAIDAKLAIPDGFHYTLNCRSGARSRNADGSVPYCASDIGCGSDCASDSGGLFDGDGGGTSCGSSCGGGGD